MKYYQTLISVKELDQLLDQDETMGNTIVFDCRFSLFDADQGKEKYEKGHVPGAIYAHLDDDLAGPITDQSGRHPLPDAGVFIRRLQDWGVNSHTQVVVYDDMGGGVATRMWWMLKWVGHDNVALLDGGYPAWSASGLSVSDETVLSNASGAEEGTGHFKLPAKDDLAIDVGDLIDRLDQGQCQLFDARNEVRFLGKKEPIDPVAGHVPGAVSLPFDGNLDENGFFLSADQLRQRFSEYVIPSDNKSIVHMCGSGVTACHNILAMEIAGISDTRLYVGSWSEWIRDSDRPVSKLHQKI